MSANHSTAIKTLRILDLVVEEEVHEFYIKMRGNPSIYRKQRVVRKDSYCALPERSQTFGKVTIFQKGRHLS